jgi:hypothetical protein
VLGLDDALSRDHDWGCRLTLLVDSGDASSVPVVHDRLERLLPASWRGQPVRFATTWDAAVSHRVTVATAGGFARDRLGVDPLRGLSAVDWLTLTGQGVLEITAGPVFADRISELGRLREILRWYPDDVDRYVLAAGWLLVSWRLPMHGRAADRGDELGSRVIAGAMATALMRLAFLVHRRWPPYEKWLGTALQSLPGASWLTGPLGRVASATASDRWQDREQAVAEAAEQLLDVQPGRGVPVARPALSQFWDRPYRHVNPSLIQGLRENIRSPELTRLPIEAGSIEQWVGNVEMLARPERRPALAAAYRTWLTGT